MNLIQEQPSKRDISPESPEVFTPENSAILGKLDTEEQASNDRTEALKNLEENLAILEQDIGTISDPEVQDQYEAAGKELEKKLESIKQIMHTEIAKSLLSSGALSATLLTLKPGNLHALGIFAAAATIGSASAFLGQKIRSEILLREADKGTNKNKDQ